MKKQIVMLCVVILGIVLFSTLAAAQLPIGTVTNPTAASCSGFQKHAVCTQYTVTCPNVAPATVIIGVNAGGAPIFLMNGSGWTSPGSNDFAAAYIADGYTVIEAAFTNSWELVGTGYTANIMNAACVPATVLSYVANGSPIAAQGGSAGSAALGYAMAWYGLSNLISVAEMASGPVFSNVELGCEYPSGRRGHDCPHKRGPLDRFPLLRHRYSNLADHLHRLRLRTENRVLRLKPIKPG